MQKFNRSARRISTGDKAIVAGRTRRDHRSDDIDGRELVRAAVDEIADENRDPLRMTPSAVAMPVSELFQQVDELVRLPSTSPMMSYAFVFMFSCHP